MSEQTVRLRFAPSNTGFLHIGGARTALYNWLEARRLGGTLVLRIEDTDSERSRDEFTDDILASLRWMGIDWDEGPIFQSQRGDIYSPHIQRLLETGHGYRCFCSSERLAEVREKQWAAKQTPRYDRLCRNLDAGEAAARAGGGEPFVIRLALPDGEVSWDDLVRGRVTWSTSELDDLVLVRSDGSPTYNLVATLDDASMEISHVIRGDDHTSNTPKQILIARALGFEPPKYGHIPLIHGPHGKLSKRKVQMQDGVKILTDVRDYMAKGYPADAFVNFLALLGWGYDGAREEFTPSELIGAFSIDAVSKSASSMNLDKLDHLGGVCIRRLANADIVAGMTPFLVAEGLLNEQDLSSRTDQLAALGEAARERLDYFSAIVGIASYVLGDVADYDAKARKNLLKRAESPTRLRTYAASVSQPDMANASAQVLEDHARNHCKDAGFKFGDLVHPVRAALTGVAGGPPLFDIMLLVGLEVSVSRLVKAAEWTEVEAQKLADASQG